MNELNLMIQGQINQIESVKPFGLTKEGYTRNSRVLDFFLSSDAQADYLNRAIDNYKPDTVIDGFATRTPPQIENNVLDKYTTDMIDSLAQYHWVEGCSDKTKMEAKKTYLKQILEYVVTNPGVFYQEASTTAINVQFRDNILKGIDLLASSFSMWKDSTKEVKKQVIMYVLAMTSTYDNLVNFATQIPGVVIGNDSVQNMNKPFNVSTQQI